MESPGGIAALGINWKFLVSQIVNFIVLFLILRFLLYKPILNMLNKRRQNIEDSQILAEKTKKETAELEIKNQEKLKQAKADLQKIMDEATAEAKQEVKQIKENAQVEAKKISDKAQIDIAADREKMIRDLKGELADLILVASGKLTRKTIKPEIQKQLVDDVIGDLKKKEI